MRRRDHAERRTPRDAHGVRHHPARDGGQAPALRTGLDLPGPPPRLGILLDPPGDPQWYLVARRNALRLAPEDIVGAVEPALGPKGGPGYTVSYGLTEMSAPSPEDRPTLVFRNHGRLQDLFFPTVTAAARWLDEHGVAPEPAATGRTA